MAPQQKTLGPKRTERWLRKSCSVALVCFVVGGGAQAVAPVPEACRTIDTKKLCVFPFTSLGVTYDTCTDFGNNGVEWCATAVDGSGNYDKTTGGTYGSCLSSCNEATLRAQLSLAHKQLAASKLATARAEREAATDDAKAAGPAHFQTPGTNEPVTREGSGKHEASFSQLTVFAAAMLGAIVVLAAFSWTTAGLKRQRAHDLHVISQLKEELSKDLSTPFLLEAGASGTAALQPQAMPITSGAEGLVVAGSRKTGLTSWLVDQAASKILSPQKASPTEENQVKYWIEAVTGERKGDQSMHEWLKNGQVLCKLANAVRPGIVKKINTMNVPVKQMENITYFMDAARTLGVSEGAMFGTPDLYENKDMGTVINALYAFGGAVQGSCPGFRGPKLGQTGSQAVAG